MGIPMPRGVLRRDRSAKKWRGRAERAARHHGFCADAKGERIGKNCQFGPRRVRSNPDCRLGGGDVAPRRRCAWKNRVRDERGGNSAGGPKRIDIRRCSDEPRRITYACDVENLIIQKYIKKMHHISVSSGETSKTFVTNRLLHIQCTTLTVRKTTSTIIKPRGSESLSPRPKKFHASKTTASSTNSARFVTAHCSFVRYDGCRVNLRPSTSRLVTPSPPHPHLYQHATEMSQWTRRNSKQAK